MSVPIPIRARSGCAVAIVLVIATGTTCGPERAAEGNSARPRRRHRGARGAADRRRAGRRHRHRRGRNPAQRRAEPGRAAAAATRRRDRAERRTGLGVRRAAARRQPRPDAGADRRPARGLVVGGCDHPRGDPARPDRSHRDTARAGVESVRRRRDRRRRAGVHEAAAGPAQGATLHAQRLRRLRHLQHGGRVGADSPATNGVAALLAAGGGRSSDGFNAIVNPDNFSYNPDRDGFSTRRTCRPTSTGRGLPDRNSRLQYFGNQAR